MAIDQRHVGLLTWRFDAAYVLWNSIGFVSRAVDLEVLSGLHRVLRPGGFLVMDMYHPTWLELNADQSGTQQGRARVATQRWVSEGRLYNRIRYQDGHTDQIDFEVYQPSELVGLLARIGFTHVDSMVWWNSAESPSGDHARYQLLLRRGDSGLSGAAAQQGIAAALVTRSG